MDDQGLLEAIAASEKIKIRYKDESRFMWLLGKILFFNPGFMTRFTTTIGDTVYFTSRARVQEDPRHAWEILCHECVHVADDRDRKGPLFSILYLMPQGLAVLALLGIVFQSWWPLLFLAFLAPIPAPWRKHFEMRGYAMTMAVHYWYYRRGIPQEAKEFIALQFTGPNYYWAWPFKGAVKQEIDRWDQMVQNDEILQQGAVYGRIRRLIQSR